MDDEDAQLYNNYLAVEDVFSDNDAFVLSEDE